VAAIIANGVRAFIVNLLHRSTAEPPIAKSILLPLIFS
jgi:hypothetical protein